MSRSGHHMINTLVLLKHILVQGDHVMPQIAKADLVDFKAILAEAFPEAKIEVETHYDPRSPGYAGVWLTPVSTPWNDTQREHLNQTAAEIRGLWVDVVSHVALPLWP